MQPNDSQTPQRRRRSDRYLTEPPAPEAPASPPPRPLAGRPGAWQQPSAPAPLQDASPIQRPEAGAEPPHARKALRAVHTVPRGLVIGLIAAALVCGGLFIANNLMTRYLMDRQEARETAHAQLLAAHPLLYRDWIEQYAAENNLQPALVAAIILNESSYNPQAESSVGARGLMQLMEDTASWIAGKVDVPGYSFARMWDPESNIRFGCWYLGYLARMFSGDPVCVASAYHAGQGTVTRWLQNPAYSADGRTLALGAMPEGPTRTYAGRVMRDYAIYDKLFWHAFNPEDGGTDGPADGPVPAAARSAR